VSYGASPTTFEGYRTLDGYNVMDDVLRSPKACPEHVEESAALTADTVLKLSGKRHAQRRILEGKLFTAEALKRYEREILKPAIARSMEELTEHRGHDGVVRVDIADYGRRLIMELTARIIGIDHADEKANTEALFEMLVAFTDCIKVQFATADKQEIIDRALSAKAEYWEQFVRPARDRRAQLLQEQGAAALPSDLLSLIVSDDSGNEEWTDDLTLRECVLFLVATGATTITLIAHVIVELTNWLAAHPEDAQRLADDRFLSGIINESLRLHPPSPAAIRECPAGLHTKTADIEPGEVVYMDLFLANQDESVFGEDASVFDPNRALPRGVHGYGLSFGVGKHACIGRPLAIGGAASGTVGAALLITRALVDAGVRVDPERPPTLAASLEGRYDELFVVFDNL
jgi:cytochrome P450